MAFPRLAAWFLDSDNPSQSTTRPSLWPIVVALANEQHGVVGRRQLLARGIPATTIDDWVAAGRLHLWYRGVYAVGHRVLGVHGRRKAAELAGGDDAALCCQTAGDLLGVKRNASGTIHVWVPNQRGRKLDGIVTHRFIDMLERDIEVVDGIRTTNAMRVIVDMAGTWTLDQIARAFDRTEELRQFDLSALEELIERRPNRPGVPRVREVKAMYEGPAPTLTELEKRGVEMIKRAGIPMPSMQWHTSEGRVDFYWPEARLVVEMDSFRWHKQRQRFERDRSRDFEHIAQGMATPRVTWNQALLPQTIDRLRRTYRNRVVP